MNKTIRIYVNSDLITDQRVQRIATSLSNAEFKIIVIGRKPADNTVLNNKSYEVKYIKTLISKGPLSYILFNIQIFFSIIFSRFSAIYANDLDTLPGCCLGATLRFKPLIYDSHELFTEIPELINSPFKKFLWKFTEQICIRKAKHVITVSESISVELNKRYNVNPVVVRNLPIRKDIETFKDSRPTIIYQGSLNLGRGIELAIDMMNHLTCYRLIIAGSGYYEFELRKRMLDQKLFDRVEFLGRLNPDELHSVTSTAWLGLSLEEDMGLNYRFALPNKLFDYIAAQVPVIVSPLPEMSKIVNNYGIGLIAKSRDPKELASQIANFFEDKNLYEQTIKNVQKASVELQWSKEEHKLIAPIKELLN